MSYATEGRSHTRGGRVGQAVRQDLTPLKALWGNFLSLPSAGGLAGRPNAAQPWDNLPPGGPWEAILSEPLDAIDARILELLQENAALSIADIAEKVGLSSSPAWRRIERLKKAGVIKKQVTLLDHEKLGLTFEVFASVKLQLPSRENLERFEAAVENWPEVVDCATVTGAVDYMLRIITKDMHAYDDFLRDKMLGLGLVSDVQSRIVMRAAKRTTAAPLELIATTLES
ncbi:MAG: Lrp/AsnC family transcriptional regulator [Alphaproteobacteria bacterium]|nr:Lrp/AsnC family transcriptional regulator [Alphaproteobacteria bacterium]